MTVSFPVFVVSDLPGVAAVTNAGHPDVRPPAGYFVRAAPGSQFGGYALYRMDGANTGSPTVTQQASFVAPFTGPDQPDLPGTNARLILTNHGNIQASPVWDGSRIWFAHTIDMNTDSTSGPATTVRYGFIDPASNTLQYALARHSPSSADFNPSIGIGIGQSSVDTVYLNWATVDAAQGLPISDTAATLLYNGGSLPALQATDQVLITGGTPAQDHLFASWSSSAGWRSAMRTIPRFRRPLRASAS